MGIAILEVSPPASRNATPNRGGRRAGNARHRAKRGLQAELARALLAAGVPRPIPGGVARATAEVLFPLPRRRDEGNYRDALEKALGDALAPAPTKEERELGLAPAFTWLDDDTPEAFTFGAVTFGQTELQEFTAAGGKLVRRRAPAIARIRLVWGEDLAVELERELDELKRRVERRRDEVLDELLSPAGRAVVDHAEAELERAVIFGPQRGEDTMPS